MKSNTKSVIDRIRVATSKEEVEVLLGNFSTKAYRFASPKTKRKAHRVAKERMSYGFITE